MTYKLIRNFILLFALFVLAACSMPKRADYKSRDDWKIASANRKLNFDSFVTEALTAGGVRVPNDSFVPAVPKELMLFYKYRTPNEPYGIGINRPYSYVYRGIEREWGEAFIVWCENQGGSVDEVMPLNRKTAQAIVNSESAKTGYNVPMQWATSLTRIQGQAHVLTCHDRAAWDRFTIADLIAEATLVVKDIKPHQYAWEERSIYLIVQTNRDVQASKGTVKSIEERIRAENAEAAKKLDRASQAPNPNPVSTCRGTACK